MTPLFLDPPEPRRLALASTPHPPLAAIDVHPCGPSARRWVFTFKDGTTLSTMDPQHAQLISQQCFPAGPPLNR